MIPYLISPATNVTPCCDQCGLEGSSVVVVGEQEKWDSRTAAICRDCHAKASILFPGPSLLDAQNQLRLKTILRILDASLSIVNDHSPVVAAAFRQQLSAPVTNLQIDAGIPLDDQLEIRP